MKNILTNEEIKILTKVKPKELNFKITKEEYLRSLCTHSDSDEKDILMQKEDSNNLYCPICGAEFDPRSNIDKKEVEDAVNKVINYIQIIKYMGEFPREVGEEIYPIIPLLKKIPDLFEYAENKFHINAMQMINSRNINREQNEYAALYDYNDPNNISATMPFNPYIHNQFKFMPKMMDPNNSCKYSTTIKDLVFDSEDDNK